MATRRLFQLLADYNVHANRSLLKILEEKTPSELSSRQAGSYFDSLLGLLNHLLVTDLACGPAGRPSMPCCRPSPPSCTAIAIHFRA